MPLSSIDEMLNDMKSGIYDFTVNGECSNCGQCCSDFLPMSDHEVAQIHAYVKKHGIKVHKHVPPTVAKVEDYTCPFRNDEERKCDIYPVRPAICRDFRCDKPRKEIEANKKLYHGRYKVVRMRQEFKG